MSKEAIAHIRKVDKTMAKLIDAVGPFNIDLTPQMETFPYLVRAIVYQQLTGKAAATIHGRLMALFPGAKKKHPLPNDFLAFELDALRSVGLSRAKASSLLDLCNKVEAGAIPLRRALTKMTDDEIIDALTTVKGIGKWSAEMLLIFNLGRLDVLPATDYGVRKGFAKVYKKKDLPTPRELLAFGERWRPFRTVPSWYLWRALELD